MITDTIVGAFLLFFIGAMAFFATVALVVSTVFLALHAAEWWPWYVALVLFLVAAHRFGEGTHISYPRGTRFGPPPPVDVELVDHPTMEDR